MSPITLGGTLDRRKCHSERRHGTLRHLDEQAGIGYRHVQVSFWDSGIPQLCRSLSSCDGRMTVRAPHGNCMPERRCRRPGSTWTADQVVERMVASVEAGDFYIICPDALVSPELDATRIRWSAEDMTQNRPALSRWHPDWKGRFDAYIEKKVGS